MKTETRGGAQVHRPPLVFRIMRGACWALAWLLALGCVVWAFGALRFDFPIWNSAVAWAFVVIMLAAVVFVRGAWRKLGSAFLGFLIVLIWWRTLKPTNDADWQPDVAQVAWAEINGDEVTLHNVRNCDYRTKNDFTPRWETRTVRLSQITGVDLAIDSYGATMLDRTFGVVKKLGHIVSIGEAEGQPFKNIRERILPRSQTFTRLHLGHVDHALPIWQAGVDHVLKGIVEGWLKVPIEGVFPLAEAAEMHRRLEARHVAGKLLLKAGS